MGTSGNIQSWYQNGNASANMIGITIASCATVACRAIAPHALVTTNCIAIMMDRRMGLDTNFYRAE